MRLEWIGRDLGEEPIRGGAQRRDNLIVALAGGLAALRPARDVLNGVGQRNAPIDLADQFSSLKNLIPLEALAGVCVPVYGVAEFGKVEDVWVRVDEP